MHLSAVDIHLLISVTSCFLFSLFFAGSSPQPVHLPGQLRFRTTLLPRGIQPGCGWEMLTWLQPPRGLLKHALQDCTLANTVNQGSALLTDDATCPGPCFERLSLCYFRVTCPSVFYILIHPRYLCSSKTPPTVPIYRIS